MKLNEIRINNYFFIGGLDRYVKVSGVFLSHFKCTDENGIDFNNHQNNVKPIELTEEILLKCGFEKIFENRYEHKDHYFELAKEKKGFIVSINCYEYTHGIHFLHLHTLQNIFYFTTNKELDIKL